MKKLMQIVFLLFFIGNPIYADIIHVPLDQPTIQAGIDAALDGDTVLVADGIYWGINNINLQWNAVTKHIVIKSANGATNCIIDCMYGGRGFILNSDQTNEDIIDGFTITNGWVKTVSPIVTGGGAILCDGTSPQIINCILTHNIAGDTVNSTVNSYFADGGAIDCINASAPIIINNIITNNFANHTGGGIHFGDSSSGIIESNIIDNNKNYGCYGGGGIALILLSNPRIINNQITNNTSRYYTVGGYGGGIICMNSDPYIVNNTIANNTTLNDGLLGQGGGIRIRGLPSPIIKNCIIWNNEAQDSLENLDFQYPQWTLDISYSNIEGGLYDINTTLPSTVLNSDPNFLDPMNGDYQLGSGSPCIDMGTPDTTGLNLPYYDLAGNPRIVNGRIDVGCFEYQTSRVLENENLSTRTCILYQNYPNPFNSITSIEYSILKSAEVIISIYDIKGNVIKRHVQGMLSDGAYSVQWNGRNELGNSVASGIYFYRIEAITKNKTFVDVKKMILMK
jgi:hypothetical protein